MKNFSPLPHPALLLHKPTVLGFLSLVTIAGGRFKLGDLGWRVEAVGFASMPAERMSQEDHDAASLSMEMTSYVTACDHGRPTLFSIPFR